MMSNFILMMSFSFCSVVRCLVLDVSDCLKFLMSGVGVWTTISEFFWSIFNMLIGPIEFVLYGASYWQGWNRHEQLLMTIAFASLFWAFFFLLYRPSFFRREKGSKFSHPFFHQPTTCYELALFASTKMLLLSSFWLLTYYLDEEVYYDLFSTPWLKRWPRLIYFKGGTNVRTGGWDEFNPRYSWYDAQSSLFLNAAITHDRLTVVFIFLTTLTIFFAICVAYTIPSVDLPNFFFLIFLTQFFLVLTFSSRELILFYIFFEASMFPTFLIIGYWGSGKRSKRAAFYFFLYTMFGSVFFLFAVLLLYRLIFPGWISLDMPFYCCTHIFGPHQPKVAILLSALPLKVKLLIFACMFVAFAMKVPIMPFHRWLPEAHVEAPTSGSVLLAGILLKLGGYGLIRLIALLPEAATYFAPYVYTLSFISVLYSSIAIFYQHDLKKIIAYASIGHMNYVVLGLFTQTYHGSMGAVYLMISHAFSSVALFILVGFLYYRHGSRNLFQFSGLVTYMPIFSFFFFMACLANFSFPGTGGFVGEFSIFLALLSTNWFLAVLMAISAILNVVYTMWLFNRLCLRVHYLGCLDSSLVDNSKLNSDLNAHEILLMVVLIGGVVIIGLFPDYFRYILRAWAFNTIVLLKIIRVIAWHKYMGW